MRKPIMFKDVSNRNLDKVPLVDLYCFSSPCGQDGNGFTANDGSLVLDCLRYVCVKRPLMVVCENAPLLFTDEQCS